MQVCRLIYYSLVEITNKMQVCRLIYYSLVEITNKLQVCRLIYYSLIIFFFFFLNVISLNWLLHAMLSPLFQDTPWHYSRNSHGRKCYIRQVKVIKFFTALERSLKQ
jgi:hypothetical protein